MPLQASWTLPGQNVDADEQIERVRALTNRSHALETSVSLPPAQLGYKERHVLRSM
ncbi:MAG: hypothetical protein WDN30_01540 [Pararobbsia sp.]